MSARKRRGLTGAAIINTVYSDQWHLEPVRAEWADDRDGWWVLYGPTHGIRVIEFWSPPLIIADNRRYAEWLEDKVMQIHERYLNCYWAW